MRSKIRFHHNWFLATALGVTWLFSTHETRADITLAKQNKSDYRIVIATNASPSEHFAAEELQLYLEKIGGAKLAITTDSEKPQKKEILLGDNAHLRKLGLKLDLTKLGPDGHILRTDGQRLIIAGNQPRGVLNGVHSLLEEKLGVRWFAPDVESVPQTNRLVLASYNEIRIPVLENRDVYWSEPLHDGVFAARHHLNGSQDELTEKEGGRFTTYYPFVHSMDELIPPALYAEHPEYFPLIKGKRVNGYVQRCLSNPDVLKLAKARVREWIKANPEATIISVSQNDAGSWCQCDQCKALDDREGSPSASLLQFVNAIAEDIEHDYPQVRIDTLAYQYSRKPPKTIRPRANVIVRLCSIECCFAHPLETCDSKQNRRFRDDIIQWHAIAPTLYVWDYVTDFPNYQQPFPDFASLQANLRFFARHGVKSIFEEGNYSSGGHGEMEPLRVYLLAELMWNPDADVARLTREFLQGYYGHAAPQLQAYFDLLEQQVADPAVHAYCGDSPKAAYLNDAFITAADKLMTEAEAAAENDAVRLRVQTARLPIWYVQLTTGRVTGAVRKELLHHFVEVAHKAGVSNISEGVALDAWAEDFAKE